jgi:histidinol dehydrogenase
MHLEAKTKKIDQIQSRLNSEKLEAVENSVKEIIRSIKAKGDEALREASIKFDNYDPDERGFLVYEKISAKDHCSELAPELVEALQEAKKRIEIFHLEELKKSGFQNGWIFSGELGEKLGVKYKPIASAGIYVPGGKAPLISTVLMSVIPAKVAGVERIVLCSPPPIDKAILAAAQLAGVNEVYAIGGAQAIAALAYGTESIKAVDKVFGPGNIYVSTAKKLVFGDVGVDGIFGPSELAIIADETAKPSYLAADLISQLEHGSGLESVLLVTDSKQLAKKTEEEFFRQLISLQQEGFKNESQIQCIKNSFEKNSAILTVSNFEEAVELINYYAPEHLEIQIRGTDVETVLNKIKNAGAIFIGANSC